MLSFQFERKRREKAIPIEGGKGARREKEISIEGEKGWRRGRGARSCEARDDRRIRVFISCFSANSYFSLVTKQITETSRGIRFCELSYPSRGMQWDMHML